MCQTIVNPLLVSGMYACNHSKPQGLESLGPGRKHIFQRGVRIRRKGAVHIAGRRTRAQGLRPFPLAGIRRFAARFDVDNYKARAWCVCLFVSEDVWSVGLHVFLQQMSYLVFIDEVDLMWRHLTRYRTKRKAEFSWCRLGASRRRGRERVLSPNRNVGEAVEDHHIGV